jgi:polyisoprenoid-binding protein YceI
MIGLWHPVALVAALAVFPGRATAQLPTMVVRPESRLILAGTSNINRWACQSGQFERVTNGEREPMTRVSLPLHKVTIAVPVRSLACGHPRMNADLREALRAGVHPDITFTLHEYRIDSLAGGNATFAAVAIGELVVAGQPRRVDIPVRAYRTAAGFHGSGTLTLRMTDFGVKPPVALLGLIRARNEITVTFDVHLDTAIVLADTRP